MPKLRVAHRVRRTSAEGPGERYALWVQGCTIRCAGCCNPEMFDPERGEQVSAAEIAAEIAAEPDLEGVTFLGGEPFEQAAALARVASAVRRAGRTVMTFTGHTLERLRASADPAVHALLDATDLLADGPFDRQQPGSAWRWLGSQNQRLHFLSDRYAADDPRMRGPNTVELRLTGGALEIVGWAPAVRRFEREGPARKVRSR
ncbi:MAG: radical SAM protein [Myxococcales bacterium]|nr:radical SAM protein [Myxococcales bacterium]